MKALLILLAFFSQASFSQTDSGEGFYQSPEMVVSGTDFTKVTDCWAKIHERENFAGRSLTLVGYTTWADLKENDIPQWVRRLSSAQVGPAARLVLYGRPYFSDEDHAITSGVSVRDLPEVPAGQEFSSLKLVCDPN